MALTYEEYYRRYLVDPLTSSSGVPQPPAPPGGTPQYGEIIVGPQGPPGPQGPQGIQGPPGATTAPVTSVFTRIGAVVATTGDYSASQVTNAVDSSQVYNNPSWIGNLAWSKLVGSPALVNTFNTRSGAVVPTSGDYTAAQVTNAVDSTQTYPNPTWLTSLAWSKLTGVPTLVNSFNTRTGAVVPVTGDYTAAQVTNAVDTTQTYANPAWITSLAYSKLTGTPTIVNTFNGRSGTVVPATGDYTAAQVTNAADTSTTYANPAWITSLAWSKITGTPSVGSYQTPWLQNINAAGFNLVSVGNLGIGISPTHILHVHGATDLNFWVDTTTLASFISFVTSNDAVTANIPFGFVASKFCFANGNMGLGATMTSPTHQLQLSTDDAAKLTTTTWSTTSGKAVKQNVKDLKGGLEIINKIRPIEGEHNGKHGTHKGQRIVSVIAEEVREVLPHTVYSKKNEADDDVLYFNPHEIIFHLILAVQQLSAELKDLKLKYA